MNACVQSSVQTLCQRGDTVTFEVRQYSGGQVEKTQKYKIGDHTDLNTEPPTLGEYSAWGELLRTVGLGQEIGLPAGDANEIFVTVIEIS